MKSRLSKLIPLAGLLMVAGSSADTFVLKNGERLDAVILKETDDSYVLDVRITPSIRDEKTVPKAEVAEIIPEKMDETSFEPLKKLVPTPDLLPAEAYTQRISQIGKFIKANPKSPLVAEAESMLSTLKAEQSAVSAGGVKMDGKIIPVDEYEKDAYEIDAKIAEKRVRDAAAAGDILNALRWMDKLDTDFMQTASRRAVAPLKDQLLRSYKARIDELLATLDARTQKRQQDLGRMTGESRANAEAALQQELEIVQRSLAGSRERKQRWSEIHEFDKESLESAQDAIEDAQNETLEDAGKDAGRVYRNIVRIIGEQSDPAVLREVVDKADEYGIPAKYTDKLKEAAKAKGAEF